MPLRRSRATLALPAASMLALALVAGACVTPTADVPPGDAAVNDAADAAPMDAPPADASPDDAPPADASPDLPGHGQDDATLADVAAPDAVVPDVVVPDVVVPDVAAHDVALPDVARAVDVSTPPVDAPAGWHLVWSDEFAGSDGTGADPHNWTQEVGGGGWGNQEREFYTAGTANASLDRGALVIRALRGAPAAGACWYGACQYTSARLVTRGHFQQRYGRFEARIRLPAGQGLWPAFWMLGADINAVSWPTCGEIDVMENIGREPGVNHGSLHGPVPGGATNLSGTFALPGGAALSADYHVYAVEWEPSVVRWYVDGALYETRTPADDPAGARWVFNHPFFLILNVAVGGNWPGDPGGTTTFPQEMRVDYVRAYAR